MAELTLHQRIEMTKDKRIETLAYAKFKQLLDIDYMLDPQNPTKTEQNRITMLNTCKIFFDLGEASQRWDHVLPGLLIRNYNDLKDFLLEICGEAINRDMIDFISKGKRGNLATKMYNQLKSNPLAQ